MSSPITIERSKIVELNLLPEPHVNSSDQVEYMGAPGREHYRLLAWLSTQFNGVEIIDIGTHHGSSAAALSFNPANKVHSFDITDKGLKVRKGNCEYHQLDLWNPDVRAEWRTRLLNSPLIFLDIDPREGKMELEFYHWLRDEQYQGLLLLDDIWFFPDMRNNFWYHIDTKKIDLTRVGHWSGTGLVDFSNRVCSPECSFDTSHWTLVTAYFDLTREPDASAEIKARPASHYIGHARATMAVEQNLIVFCDQISRDQLESLRPAHLRAKTHYIMANFGEFDLVQNYRQKIADNRKTHPYHFDNRNTPSYYLFCMLRYVMVNMAIEQNPFQSTHFGWVNMCIERMGWKNLAALNEALGQNRNKFSTCWIDYQPQSLVINYPAYFTFGRCGMCSGFFTGRHDHFKAFNSAILQVFSECLQLGYGHADEQLYSIVYFRYPDIFEPYFGDYTEMITNYVEVRDRVTEPVRNIIQHAFQHADYAVCLKACWAVWSHRDELPGDALTQYVRWFMLSAIFMRDWVALDKLSIYIKQRLL